MTVPDPEPAIPVFDQDLHPRHTTSGQFVSRGDVHQAMNRIHNGAQGRTALPQPQTPEHPNS